MMIKYISIFNTKYILYFNPWNKSSLIKLKFTNFSPFFKIEFFYENHFMQQLLGKYLRYGTKIFIDQQNSKDMETHAINIQEAGHELCFSLVSHTLVSERKHFSASVLPVVTYVCLLFNIRLDISRSGQPAFSLKSIILHIVPPFNAASWYPCF